MSSIDWGMGPITPRAAIKLLNVLWELADKWEDDPNEYGAAINLAIVALRKCGDEAGAPVDKFLRDLAAMTLEGEAVDSDDKAEFPDGFEWANDDAWEVAQWAVSTARELKGATV